VSVGWLLRLVERVTFQEFAESPSFSAFVPTYLQYLKAKRRDSDQRNEKALNLHLISQLGSKCLADLRLEDGLLYLEKRRAEHAAEVTIERE